MMPLSIAAGDGRLVRSTTTVLFAAAPDAGLVDLVQAESKDLFKQLATLIVSRDFVLTSFVAIDSANDALFLFGDLEVEIGGTIVSGADSATWVEHRLEPGAAISCGDREALALGTDLVQGSVPAGGFLLGVANGAAAAPPQAPEPLPVEVAVEAEQVEPPAVAAARPGDVQSVVDVLADPQVNLDTLGSPVREPASAAPAETDDAYAVFESDDTEPPFVSDVTVLPDLGPVEASSPFRAPPPVSALDDRVAQQLARLRSSTGRQLTVATGLLVGRFPTKHGVPDGYDTLKVSGSEVSRVHLEFIVEGDTLYVRDRDTANGSTRVALDRTATPVPRGTQRVALQPGDSVEFGDQAVTFEGWERA